MRGKRGSRGRNAATSRKASSGKLRRFALARFEALDVEGADKSDAKALRSALEHEIISRVSGADGAQALSEFIAELNELGHRLTPITSDPGWRSWYQATNEGARQFHVHVSLSDGDDLLTVMVLYGETLETTVRKRRAGMSRAEKAQAEIEDQFISRGLALNTSDTPYKSLGTDDRLIACLHELEGGVNNGGFSTFISNTGGARLKDAQAFLLAIGAHRTARIIASVRSLFPRGFGAAFRRDEETLLERHRVALDRLASRFYDLPENIPLLAMTYLTSRAEKTGRHGARRPRTTKPK